jgi:nucleotide-binding universal stress UspA family protein
MNHTPHDATPALPTPDETMSGAIVHPATDLAAAALARELAARLDLRSVELSGATASLDAALAIAPAGLGLYRAPRIPVVVLTRAAAALPPLRGSSLVCGVQDDADAACVAIADALASKLELPLTIVHVVSKSEAGDSRETVMTVARAAGLDRPEELPVRLLRGAPGRAIAVTARCQDAALVVVSESVRRLPKRAFVVSATGYLARRCRRPVLVCPRDPAAAMRVRAALALASNVQPRRA